MYGKSCLLVYEAADIRPLCALVLGPAAGMAGSQLDGTQTGGVASCPRITSPRQIYADISWLKNLPCFAHMLSVSYDHSTGR
jgi:hypothetical protein